MKCGKSFNFWHSSSEVCGTSVSVSGSPISVCSKCRDELILKLSKHIDMDVLDHDEYEFISQLIKNKKQQGIQKNITQSTA